MPDPIPDFEGAHVAAAFLKLRVSGRLDCDDRIVQMDDVVKLEVLGRVAGVTHELDEKRGELHRIQAIRVAEVDFAPWQKPDHVCLDCGSTAVKEVPQPGDDGVLREQVP